MGNGYNYLCVETGVVIHNSYELKDYLNNPKARSSHVARQSRSGGIAYGYH